MSADLIQSYGGAPGQAVEMDKSVIPLGRVGDGQDMGGTILYLTTRAGAYLNGNVIVLDGGRLGTFPSTI